jgi:hypothetical protein
MAGRSGHFWKHYILREYFNFRLKQARIWTLPGGLVNC